MSRQDISKIRPSSEEIKYFKNKMRNWSYKTDIAYPWRTTKNKFHALVAEVLLQRTRAEQVVPVYHSFRSAYRSPLSLAQSSASKVERMISSLGLKWRARKLKELGQHIYKKLKGRIPSSFEELISLPGVGPYAAAAYLSFHNRKRAILIDSNIIRLYGRFFNFQIHPEIRRSRMLMKLADILTPYSGYKTYNYAVLDFGRNVCQPIPKCFICRLSNKCKYYKSHKEHK